MMTPELLQAYLIKHQHTLAMYPILTSLEYELVALATLLEGCHVMNAENEAYLLRDTLIFLDALRDYAKEEFGGGE